MRSSPHRPMHSETQDIQNRENQTLEGTKSPHKAVCNKNISR